MHVHVEKGDGIAKIWLMPVVRIAYSEGFSVRDKRIILMIVSDNLIILKKGWNAHFSAQI